MKIKDYMMIGEAAKFLGVSPNTLRNWGKEGSIKVRRCSHNNFRLYKKEDLEQFLKDIEDSLSFLPR